MSFASTTVSELDDADEWNSPFLTVRERVAESIELSKQLKKKQSHYPSDAQQTIAGERLHYGYTLAEWAERYGCGVLKWGRTQFTTNAQQRFNEVLCLVQSDLAILGRPPINRDRFEWITFADAIFSEWYWKQRNFIIVQGQTSTSTSTSTSTVSTQHKEYSTTHILNESHTRNDQRKRKYIYDDDIYDDGSASASAVEVEAVGVDNGTGNGTGNGNGAVVSVDEDIYDDGSASASASAVEVEAVGVDNGTGNGTGTGNGNGAVVSVDEDIYDDGSAS